MTKPFKFPLGFDEFLRWLMPKKRVEDRMRLLRAYFRDALRVDRYMQKYWGSSEPFDIVPIPDDEEIATLLANWKTRKFDEPACVMLAGTFNGWLAKYEANIFHNRAKTAAAGRWRKKNDKKPVKGH